MNNVLIVDGHYLMHRLGNIPEYNLTSSNGTPTGILFGFLRSLHLYLRDPVISNINQVYCVFDGRRSSRRKALYPEYKHKARSKAQTEEEKRRQEEYKNRFYSQREAIKELLPHMNVRVIQIDTKEGDDTCYRVARQVHNTAEEIVFYTDDSDYVQMIPLFRQSVVYRPIKKDTLREDKLTLEKEGVPSLSWFLLKKAIVGDSADNIPPAVKGVGSSTASMLIELANARGIDVNAEFGSLVDQLISCCNEKGGLLKKIVNSKEEFSRNLQRNLDLIDLRREVWTEEEEAQFMSQMSQPVSFDERYIFESFVKYGIKSLSSIFVESHFRLLR